jgi:sugar phosphate isomerase/epimerase
MTRRTALALPAAHWAAPRWKLAICNETFQGASFDAACRVARRTGYHGIEVQPSTLSPEPANIAASRRQELRRTMRDEGIAFAGLHNILASPAGLHLTTADEALRSKSWSYLRRLIDLCADLGPGVIVLGSSRQRAAPSLIEVPAATRRLEEGLAALATTAHQARTPILLEPLAPHLCNVVNTLAEAMTIVRRIGSPGVQTMLDTHNTAAETQPADALVRAYAGHIRHVHVNEMDGKRPGAGGYDFRPLFRGLRATKYEGWVSVEVFDFSEGGERIASSSARYLRAAAAGA